MSLIGSGQFCAGSASEVCVVKLVLIYFNQRSAQDMFYVILVLESSSSQHGALTVCGLCLQVLPGAILKMSLSYGIICHKPNYFQRLSLTFLMCKSIPDKKCLRVGKIFAFQM